MQKIFLFDQDRETPKDYYDPNNFLSEAGFIIEPDEEIFCLVNNVGFGSQCDIIYSLHLHDIEDENGVRIGEQLLATTPSTHQLVVSVKNCSTLHTLAVGRKTSLALLLAMPRVRSRLCYYSSLDLSIIRGYYYQPAEPCLPEGKISIF